MYRCLTGAASPPSPPHTRLTNANLYKGFKIVYIAIGTLATAAITGNCKHLFYCCFLLPLPPTTISFITLSISVLLTPLSPLFLCLPPLSPLCLLSAGSLTENGELFVMGALGAPDTGLPRELILPEKVVQVSVDQSLLAAVSGMLCCLLS